jgi:hypothetical protein
MTTFCCFVSPRPKLIKNVNGCLLVCLFVSRKNVNLSPWHPFLINVVAFFRINISWPVRYQFSFTYLLFTLFFPQDFLLEFSNLGAYSILLHGYGVPN